MITTRRFSVGAAMFLAAAGCASTPKPTADLASARSMVSQAEQSDA